MPAMFNNDNPEGTLDAILQAVVCQEAIGWRQNARRLLLVWTDDMFHLAGDGRLAGIDNPNDGECHLDNNGFYNFSTLQDYPSISQVIKKVDDYSINLVFVVTSRVKTFYDFVSAEIKGSSVGLLEQKGKSSNIINLVKEQYNNIRSSVEMKSKPADHLKVSFYTSCNGAKPMSAGSKCDGLKVGTVVSFTAEIVLTSCPADPHQWSQTLTLYPVSINKSLIVDVKMLCDCACEQPEQQEKSSLHCSRNGSLQCGKCTCDSGRIGRTCECDSTEGKEISEDTCNGKDGTTCSGHGDCLCGQCKCVGEYYGDFCQCENTSCLRKYDQLCSGPEHGECHCGECQCRTGWTGKDCSCSTESCLINGKVCSGRGLCDCGKCKCEDSKYFGEKCEKCLSCLGEKCQDLRDCVDCTVFKQGPLSETCQTNCSSLTITNITRDFQDQPIAGESFCEVEDQNNCIFQFIYFYDMQFKINILSRNEKTCPDPLKIIVIAGTGSVLLIGLLTLVLWKIVTTVYDKRELAKFMKEITSARWSKGENPLFIPPQTAFQNPTYDKLE